MPPTAIATAACIAQDLHAPTSRAPRLDVAGGRRDPKRRCALIALLGCALPTLASSCAGGAGGAGKAEASWEARLRGDTIALMGEVHDNRAGHAQRLQALQRAVSHGWRPTIAMEQFDHGRQSDIERARRERPRDADHLIAQAGGAGWEWPLYRPLVQLALDHDLPLVAVNLPRVTAMRLVREPADAVFGSERAAMLGLARVQDPLWLQAQEQEIDAGHCGMLPPPLLPGMVRAQAARDALMALEIAGRGRDRGVVLIAGNGHVRRDLGVARWLRSVHGVPRERLLAVGYVEAGPAGGPAPAERFDALVTVPSPPDRPDPCAVLRARPPDR